MAAIGFTPEDDPAATGVAGYRSHKLARKGTSGNNQILRGSDVSYNGFVFPPQIKAKATVVQEYTKDQRSVKYLTVALTIEAIITPYDMVTPTGFADSTVPGTNQPGVTVDHEMDDIKERLSQPCQALSFSVQGFGTFLVNGPPSHLSVATPSIVYDVDYGPRPQVLDWEPIAGSIACRIQWLVTTRIPACGRTVGINGLKGVLDFSYEIAWDVNEAGFFSRTVSGMIELARSRTANRNGIHADNAVSLVNDNAQYNAIVTSINNLFPILGGFTRSESFNLQDNKKFYTFSLTDTEIPSPTPIPKGILNINLTESLSSNLQVGFRLWRWNFNGDISVYNSKATGQDIILNKRLAFNAFYLILKERLARTKGTMRKKLANKESPTGSEGWQQQIRTLPINIDISNDIFGTGLSASLTFNLYCGPNELLAATGIFDAVRDSGMTWDDWRNHYVNSGTRVLYPNAIPDYDAIVDLCHPLTTYTSPTSSPKRNPAPTTSPIFYNEVPRETESWTGYQNGFITETSYQTTGAVLLSPGAAPYQPNLSTTPNTDSTPKIVPPPPGSSPSDSTNSSSYLAPDIHTGAHPVTVITMVGRASRIGYPINAPELQSIGGKPVIKYGTDLVVPSQQPSGFTKNGVLANIHSLQWRKSYILTGYPEANQGDSQWAMKSDGHPQIFT